MQIRSQLTRLQGKLSQRGTGNDRMRPLLAQIVEDEYGVVLKGEDMKELKTVGDAIELIASRAA